MVARVLVSGLVVLVLAACSETTLEAQSANYPSEVRTNFLEACTAAGSSQATCECMLQEIEANISFSEFTSLELRGDEAIAADTRIVNAAIACVPQ